MLSFEQLDAFAAAFSTLGRLHITPVTPETRDQVVDLLDEWPAPASGESTAAGINAWHRSRAQEESASDIHRDHDLLYGITANAKVPPFESVHRNEEGLVFDSETLEVRDQYRRLGLQAPNLNREPDDHIGLELDFLAQCCVSALTALEQDAALAAERYARIGGEFSRDHLLTWAPDMLEKARAASQTEWMGGLQLMTLGTLEAWESALESSGVLADAEELSASPSEAPTGSKAPASTPDSEEAAQ
ncbi:MAG: TorD/DmsD family molecular chaperone [Ancrocorticia sp.]|uniref:TorD/DmsD family molecular chaperone n=1 Tax=Ancrocorticia sp. TaxID=2593684 RepID=UPI003F8F2E7C